MSRQQILQKLKQDAGLYLSYSQLSSYLLCSQKYRYRYVEKRPRERVSASLFLGTALHTAIERFYLSVKDKRQIEPLDVLEEIVAHSLAIDCDLAEAPIKFKREAPDRQSLISLGKSLIRTFYENVDQTGFQIVGVEMPVAAELFDENGEPTDFKLVGVIDLLLRDNQGELVIVDNKTSVKAKSQTDVDADLQFSSYSYLLAATGMAFARADIKCRMDVLRKLKVPTFEQYHTVRTPDMRRRFSKIASTVLQAISSNVFLPNQSWLCSDCEFSRACRRWHQQ